MSPRVYEPQVARLKCIALSQLENGTYGMQQACTWPRCCAGAIRHKVRLH